MVATERKCLACRKRDADTNPEWPAALCFSCMRRAGDIQEVRRGADVVCTVDDKIRGGVLRLEDDGFVAVVSVRSKEVTVPVANLVSVL